jgi:NAD+ diphosphatase
MIPFSGSPLDRRGNMRADQPFIAGKLHDPSSLILPLMQQAPLFAGKEPALKIQFLSPALCEPLPEEACIFLGIAEGIAYFAFDMAALDQVAQNRISVFGRFLELRAAAPMLPPRDLAIAAQAKALTEWHLNARFCSRCGAQTFPGGAGNKRDCPSCHAEHFPRLDPAVIMLATHGEHCLLARNAKWTADFLSTLAGFVEPGESLEEAVRRELYEEAGVIAGRVTYFASQPWPFPAALMLGFFAECENKELMLDTSEIAEAQWFTRAEARALLNGLVPGRRGPSPIAIASHLIGTWANEGE